MEPSQPQELQLKMPEKSVYQNQEGTRDRASNRFETSNKGEICQPTAFACEVNRKQKSALPELSEREGFIARKTRCRIEKAAYQQ